jgi:hypothetical protein
MIILSTFVEFHNRNFSELFLVSFKIQKFWIHYAKAMAVDKIVNIAATY